MTTNDPAALFRAMLGEWEKMANSVGGDALRSDEWTRAMHGAQNAGLQAQAAWKDASTRALAAAKPRFLSPHREPAVDGGCGARDVVAMVRSALGRAPGREFAVSGVR